MMVSLRHLEAAAELYDNLCQDDARLMNGVQKLRQVVVDRIKGMAEPAVEERGVPATGQALSRMKSLSRLLDNHSRGDLLALVSAKEEALRTRIEESGDVYMEPCDHMGDQPWMWLELGAQHVAQQGECTPR